MQYCFGLWCPSHFSVNGLSRSPSPPAKMMDQGPFLSSVRFKATSCSTTAYCESPCLLVRARTRYLILLVFAIPSCVTHAPLQSIRHDLFAYELASVRSYSLLQPSHAEFIAHFSRVSFLRGIQAVHRISTLHHMRSWLGVIPEPCVQAEEAESFGLVTCWSI